MNEMSYFSVSRNGPSKDRDADDLSQDISDIQREIESKQTLKKKSRNLSQKKAPHNPYQNPKFKQNELKFPG